MDLEKKVVELDLNDVLPNRFQPRIKFNSESINELTESIKEHGVIQPIVVRALGDKYEIIAGERRYKATELSGKKTIPAIITTLNDKESAEVALVENIQRKDLTAIEEAVSYKKILDMGHITQEELAAKVGKTQSTIANKIRLLNLDDEVQEALLEEKISERHARSLLKISDSEKQREMLQQIISKRLTVRATDTEIDKLKSGPEKIEKESPKEEVIIIEEKVEDMDLKNDNMQIFDPFNIGAAEPQEPSVPSFEEVQPVSEEIVIPEVSIPFDTPVEPMVDLPQMPAIEELPSVPLTEPIVETPDFTFNEINIEQTINPGFMDLDKIENEAMDINIEKPIADLGTLLQPVDLPDPVLPVEPVVMESIPEMPSFTPVSEETPSENKFFSFTDTKKETQAMPAQPLNENPFNFQMAQPSTPVEAVSETPPPNPFGLEFSAPTPQPTAAPVEEKVSDFLNPNFDFNVSAPVVREEINFNEINSAPAPAMTKNISEAVAMVKECGNNLRNLGFNVSIEETDFESTYNINIRIEK